LLPWDPALPHLNPYLIGAVALIRGFRGLDAGLDKLEARSCEDLSDELVRLCPKPGEIQGLPNQMMVTPADRVGRAVEGNSAVVLAVLTHLSGRVFDQAISPRVAEPLLKGEALDLWVPVEATHV